MCRKDIVQRVVPINVTPVPQGKERQYVQNIVIVLVHRKDIFQRVTIINVKSVQQRKEPQNVQRTAIVFVNRMDIQVPVITIIV